MKDKMFIYEQVAQKVEENIAALHLKPGDKITSVRKLSKEFGVSLSTVFQAYSLLEAKGVISPKERSGYIVSLAKSHYEVCEKKNINSLPQKVETTSMAIATMKNVIENNIVNFSVLAPSNEFLPLNRLNRNVSLSLNASNNENYQYSLIGGHPRLVKQIALRTINWENTLDLEEVLVTNGCMEAINLCLDAITRKGDIIAVECPTFNGILQSLEQRGLQALAVNTCPRNGVDLDELEKVLDSYHVAACIFMPSCHNPTGASMPEENKKRLADILGSREIPLIEDDSLRELSFNGGALPVKAYDTHDNVLYCTSFSKTLAPGFRIGFLSAGKYHRQIESLKYVSNMSTNGVFQDAIGRYLESGDFDKHLRKMRRELQGQVLRYTDAVLKYFPKNIRISVPSGGLSLWIELPAEMDTYELQKNTLEKKVGICCGDVFSACKEMHHYIRINYGALYSPKIEKAIETVGMEIKKMIGDAQALPME